MDWWLASFFLGAILSLFLPIVPDLFLLFLLLLLSVIFFYAKPLRLSSGLLFGMSWMLFNGYNFQNLWQENNLNAIELSSEAQWVQGQVLSLYSPQKQSDKLSNEKLATRTMAKDKRLRFDFNVTHLNNQQLNKALRLRLSWTKNPISLQQGQTARLKVKIKPAHGLANLGSFSYQTWLKSKGISATGYVVKHEHNELLIADNTMRQQLFNDYKVTLPEHNLTPLLLALGFGSRSELTADLWQVLQATGTGHLIAISGLHIGLVATGSYYLFMLVLRALPLRLLANSYQLQTINIRYFAIAFSLLVALSYGYLAGFSLPTIRALVMLSIYWCARLLLLKISIKRWILFTLFCLTVATPFSLFTASFWLSVYAVIIIFITLWRFKNTISTGNYVWRFIKGLLVIQLSLTLMLLPISAVFFQQISVVALFANIFAVPWMSFLSIPLGLLSVLLMPVSDVLSQFFIMLCLESLQYLWHYLSYLSTQSWSVLVLSSVNIKLLVLGGLLSVLLLFLPMLSLLKVSFNAKRAAVLLCCSICIVFSSSIMPWSTANSFSKNEQESDKSRQWQLVVFDVGQGLSVLIQQHDKAILYDTGASYASGFNMVEAVVLPYVQYAGIKQLDKVIISHSDNDHAGGLGGLQQSIVIDELIYNASKTHSNRAKLNSTCQQGRVIHWQGLDLEMLWPEKVKAEENDDSCVLLISDGKHKVLLTGDISKSVEAKLVAQYPQLRADVLIVPHHGSKTSSSDSFLSQVKPKFAIASAGFLNRWHMPVKEVKNRYQEHNIQLLNSAESGQIIFNFSEQGMVKRNYYDDLWPFWFAN